MGPHLKRRLPAHGGAEIRVIDEASVSHVRETVRAACDHQGLDRERRESLVTAASELGWNQLRHAGGGDVLVRSIARAGVRGVEVEAADAGPGIPHPGAALDENTPQPSGLGAGLAGAYRLADEMDFDIRMGEGSYLAVRKFARPLPRREVALLGRPLPGEVVSGDDGTFCWCDQDTEGGPHHALMVAVADGLGHGREARAASRLAVVTVLRDVSHALHPIATLQACHEELTGTRGAVMAIAIADAQAASLRHAAIGNVSTHVYRGRDSLRLASTPGVLGNRTLLRPRAEVVPLSPRQLLLMYTDGLSSRVDLSHEAQLLRRPPVAIAEHLLAQQASSRDDALVLIASI